MIETKSCRKCKIARPLGMFRTRKSTGYVEHVCRLCRNEHARLRNAGLLPPNPYGESVRKLPPYDVLKRQYVQEGKSLQDLATLHNSTKTCIQQALYRRAKRRGEWPLLTPAQVVERTRRANQVLHKPGNFMVDRGIIRDLLREYLAEHGMAIDTFADLSGLSKDFVGILAGNRGTRRAALSPAYAVRVLECIGEPVPGELRRRAQRGNQPKHPAKLRLLRAVADVTAWSSPDAAADVQERVG